MSFKWQIKFRLIIHFSANFLNNQRQVDDARIMVGQQFHMMTIRQLCRFCQRKRRGGGDNVIMGLTVMGDQGSISLRFNDRARPVCDLRISRQPVPPEDGAAYVPIPVRPAEVDGAEPLNATLCGKTDIPQAPFFLEANRNAVIDLMAAIEEERQPLSNASTARTTLEMIFGVYTSQLEGRRTAFPLACRSHPLVK